MYGENTIAPLVVGHNIGIDLSLTTAATFTIDAGTDQVAHVFQCDRAMDIDEIGFNLAVKVGSPTVLVSIQGVNLTDGKPDGTIKGGGSPASVEWAPSTGGWQWATLSNAYTVARGEFIAVVVEDGTTGTTPSGSNYLTFYSVDSRIYNSNPNRMTSTDTGSTWTKDLSKMPSIAFRDSTDTTSVMGHPAVAYVQSTGLVSTTIGHISAQKFRLSTALGRRVKVHGIDLGLIFTTGDPDIGIYSETGAEVVAASLDKDIAPVSAAVYHGFAWITPTWIDTGVTYYAGIKYAVTGGGVIMYGTDFETDDNLSANTGYPYNNMSKWNGSAWVDVVGCQSPITRLLISEWDKHGQSMQELARGVSR